MTGPPGETWVHIMSFWWHVNWQHMNSPKLPDLSSFLPSISSPHLVLHHPICHHLLPSPQLSRHIYDSPSHLQSTTTTDPSPPWPRCFCFLLKSVLLFMWSSNYLIPPPPPSPPTYPIVCLNLSFTLHKPKSPDQCFWKKITACMLCLHSACMLCLLSSLSKEDCLYTGANWLRIICPSDGGRGQLNTLTTKAAELGTVDLSPGGKFCADSSSIVLAVNNFILTHTSSWGSHAWKRRKLARMYSFSSFFVSVYVKVSTLKCTSIFWLKLKSHSAETDKTAAIQQSRSIVNHTNMEAACTLNYIYVNRKMTSEQLRSFLISCYASLELNFRERKRRVIYI